MSYAKFAPMTANLLARKGEAVPSLETKRPMAWMSELPTQRGPDCDRRASIGIGLETTPHEDTVVIAKPAPIVRKSRRIVVSLDPCEFERLGIAAAKKGIDRHELVRETMNRYLLRLAAQLNHRCVCLRDDSQCGGSSGNN